MADVEGEPPVRRPGSAGEHALQRSLGTTGRADRFYDEQVLDHLNARMREFTERQEMFFLATADGHGECDSSFRAGPPGFLRVLDERTLVYPEYRGNGVHASLGNLQENPHLGILMVDFVQARIGLHINGRAEIVEDAELRAAHPDLPLDPVPGRRAQLWVRVTVEEAYIHCSKHIPRLEKAPKRTDRDWGTDDYKRKGGDFFGAAREAREARAAREQASGEREVSPARPEIPEPRAARDPRGEPVPPRPSGARRRPLAPPVVPPRPTHPPAVPPPPAEPPVVPAASPASLPAVPLQPNDPVAWRLEAERALAEAQRRGDERGGTPEEASGFPGWFG